MSMSITGAVGSYVVATVKPTMEPHEYRLCPNGHGDDHTTPFCPDCGAPIITKTEMVEVYDIYENVLPLLDDDMFVTFYEACDVGEGDYESEDPDCQVVVVLSGRTLGTNDDGDIDPVAITPDIFVVREEQLAHMREVFATVSEVKCGVLHWISY